MYLELHVSGKPRLFNFNFVSEVSKGRTGTIIAFNHLDEDGAVIEIEVDESYDYIKEKLLSHQRAMIPQSHLI